MLALTIWQPFASLIVGSPPTDGCPGAPPQKPVENRDWRPSPKMIGQRIAIHAGKKPDRETLDLYEDIFKAKVFGEVAAPYAKPKLFPLGAVVGVATLDRVIGPLASMSYEDRFSEASADWIASWGLDADGLRWFVGGFGWVFRDRQHLVEPVQCSGAQGLWRLPPDVERAVTEQLARAA
jgi:hypothetical protein